VGVPVHRSLSSPLYVGAWFGCDGKSYPWIWTACSHAVWMEEPGPPSSSHCNASGPSGYPLSLSLSLTMAFAWTILRPIASSVSAGTTKPMRVGRKQQPAGRKQKCVRLEKNGSAPPNLTPWINKEGGSASQLYLVLAPTQSVSRQSRSSGNRAGRCAKIGLQHGTRVRAEVVEIGFGG
jgi:hypothetical protein